MTAVAAWVLLPLVVGVASLGCGLLLEIAAGTYLPGPLLIPAGFAVVVVASQFPPLSSQTAALAPPLIVGLAFAGFALGFPRLRRLADPWAPAAAVGVFGSYAAPVVLSGRATFAGYVKLDDTATYLAMLDRVEHHGRSLAGLAPSTYEATLATSLAYGYPLGSFAPLGVAQRLLGVDAAWLWQPYLTTLAALLALALYVLAAPLVPGRASRAAVAVVAAQPAILYGYALWGGVKELTVAALLATLCACVPVAINSSSARAVLPLAVTSAAIVGALSVGGAAWLIPLAAVLVLIWRRQGALFAGRAVAAFVIAGAALAIPAIVAALDWLGRADAFTSESELGNLIRPLKLAQIAGIWPVGDFRRSPDDTAPTYGLVAVVVLAAIGGVAWAWSRRAWEQLVYVGGALAAALIFYELGSPWIAGKALATAAPAVLLPALAAAAALAASARRVEAVVIAAAIVGGVAWSNVLAYREVWLAPQPRLAELESIGAHYPGGGPALMTEYESYGARHFLRKLDAEGTSELRRHVIPLRSGQPLAPQAYADIDRFSLPGLLAYRLLVLRRSPVASRPSSVYRLVERRHWYEVWRLTSGVDVLEHLPLGTETDPGAIPECGDVERLARLPGVTALRAVPRRALLVIPFPVSGLPGGWTPGLDAGTVDAKASGQVTSEVRLGDAGRYEVWIGGSFVGRVSVTADGAAVGAAHHQLEWPGQYVRLGDATLRTGGHRIVLRYDVGGWRPGSHGLAPFSLGPLVVAEVDARRVVSVAPSAARSLCGRRLDWVEAVG